MKYISIDLETTGLDPNTNQILSLGCIVEDTKNILPYDELPKLHCYVTDKKITGDVFAINMNRKIIEKIATYNEIKSIQEKILYEKESGVTFTKSSELWTRLYYFISQHLNDGKTGKIYVNVAGKNFGTFDKLFLDKLPKHDGHEVKFRQSILDPAILSVDWSVDERLPSLDECKARSGDHGNVTHDALEDSWDVIKLLRKNYE